MNLWTRCLRRSLPTPNFLRENLLYLTIIQKALSAAKIRPAQAEAELLIQHFGKIERLDFLTGKRNVPPRVRSRIKKALSQRLLGKPLNHLTGYGDFLGRRFQINAHTLIPRPETELLVQEALKIRQSRPRILDLGTGSGSPPGWDQ